LDSAIEYLRKGRPKQFRIALNRAFAHTAGFPWPELRRQSNEIAQILNLQRRVTNSDEPLSRADLLSLHRLTGESADINTAQSRIELSSQLTRAAQDRIEILEGDLRQAVAEALSGLDVHQDWRRFRIAISSLEDAQAQVMSELAALRRPRIADYIKILKRSRRNSTALRTLKWSVGESVNRGPGIIDAISKIAGG
jgi:hypothetical protein